MDFAALFGAVKENPAAALLALALLALGWLLREHLKTRDAHAAEQKALHEAFVNHLQKQHGEHLATAMQVAPLASKLADCVTLISQRAGSAP